MNSAYLIAMIAGVIAASATGDAFAAAPTLPGERCATEPRVEWTEPERWAWTEICEGRLADFNRRSGTLEQLDPGQTEGWDDTRKLSQNFLESILLHDPFRTAVPRRGVRIDGAWFPDRIDLEHAHVGHVLWLDNSRFDRGLNLTDAHFQSQLTFDGSKTSGRFLMYRLEAVGGLRATGAEFTDLYLSRAKVGRELNLTGATVSGALEMDSIEVGGDLFMGDGAKFASVDLHGAKVGGQLNLIGASVSGMLDMNSIDVGVDIFMGGARFAAVDLIGATVGDWLDLTRATVSGTLDMDSLEVGGHLRMGNGAAFATVDLSSAKVGGKLILNDATVSGTLDMDTLEVGADLFMKDGAFADVNLTGATVGDWLDMSGAKVSGELKMGSLEVGGHVYMRDRAEFDSQVVLLFAHIGSNLDLSGARLASLDLTGSKLGELRLGSAEHESAQWHEGALLVLRNTEVNAIQDRLEPDSWPPRLVLDGFTYQRLGGLAGAESEVDMAARPASWFTEWLARDQTYSPQPYRQLAGLLRAAGDDGKADTILYSGRERERDQSEGLVWGGLTLLKYTIGYGLGYRQFWSLYWVAGFVLTGVMVLWRSGAISTKGLPWTIACSFDLLLPIVKLDDGHREYVQQMGGPGVYYFYAHQLAGWILASFLIAGLSGLTKF